MIADLEYPAVCLGLTTILDAVSDFEMVPRYGVGEWASRAGAAGWAPLVAVVVDLDGSAGGRCVEAVQRLSTSCSVLVMSVSELPVHVFSVLREGAGGYVTARVSERELVAAVRTVAANRLYLPAELAAVVRAELGRPGVAPEEAVPVRLSRREEEVLGLLARGYTHRQTARRMGISESTVNTYVDRIRSKLKIGNKAQLAVAALEHFSRS